jgi:hypothetical protein
MSKIKQFYNKHISGAKSGANFLYHCSMKKLLLILFCLPMIGFGQCLSGDCVNGKGIMKKGGERYEGCFRMHLKHGIGTVFFKGGDKYSGSFKDDNMDGYGVYTFVTGMIVKGDWEDGMCLRCDTVQFLIDNNIISGCLEGDCDNGYGVYLWPSGAKYEGEWMNGYENGKGIWYNTEGDKYVGEFKDRLREGFGVYFYENGHTYEGEWRNGNYHGEGIYSNKGRTIIMKGIWDNHVPVKYTEILKNGEKIDPKFYKSLL